MSAGRTLTTWTKQMAKPGPGRPAIPADVKEAARAHTPEALNTLASIMRDKRAPAAARVKASEALLERAWGRAVQQTTTTPASVLDSLSDNDMRVLVDAITALEHQDKQALIATGAPHRKPLN